MPPEGFAVAARIYHGRYSVEGSIPVEFIQSISHNNELYFGAYRAEFKRKDNAIIENWLTLKDPRTRIPDFHVPSSLVKLILDR